MQIMYEIVSVRFSVRASSFGIGFKTELFVDYIRVADSSIQFCS